MSPDSYPTDRARTDAVLDAYTTLLAENTALMKACAQLIDDANQACDERDQALAANTILRSR